MSYIFAGDFYYKNDNNIGKADVEELMYFHYEFFKQQSNKYVTSGSVLWCNAGSKISYFDLPVDHGVEREDGAAVGSCSDCKINQNVYCFGGCSKTSPAGYPQRKTVIISQSPSRIDEREKCIPMLNNTGWQKTTPSSIKIWDYVDKRFYDALTSGDFLTCFYGGCIRVIEVLSKGSWQPAIIKDWLRLYSSPTVSGTGRHVAKHPNANNYDWGMPEELLIYDSQNKPNPENYSTASMAATMINAAGGSLIVIKESNNAYTDDEGRYWIAVGPNFMNPNHTSNMQLKPEQMYYGTKIDIHVIGQHDGKDYYIPAVVGDAKEHSKPDGLYQTGVPFDSTRPTVLGDGSTVEFIGYGITTFIDANGNSKNTINYTNDYNLIELIVYDGNVNY